MCLVSDITFWGFNLYGGSYAFARGSSSSIYFLTGELPLTRPFPATLRWLLLSGVNERLSMSLQALSRKA